jgi:hypothetical protein
MCLPTRSTSSGPDSVPSNPINAWWVLNPLHALSLLPSHCYWFCLSLIVLDDEIDKSESTPTKPSTIDGWQLWQIQS